MLALQGETSEARAWIDEARTMSRDLGETRETALALEGIGWTHFFRSEDEAACAAFEECLRLQRAGGDQHLVIRAMVGLAQILVALGRTSEAKPMAQEIIEFAEAHNDKRSEHFGWHYLAVPRLPVPVSPCLPFPVSPALLLKSQSSLLVQ